MEREPKRLRQSRLLLADMEHWIAAAHAERVHVLESRSSGVRLAMTMWWLVIGLISRVIRPACAERDTIQNQ